MSETVGAFISGGLALGAACLVAAWQLGGARASRRRRLNQELDILAKIPHEWKVRGGYERLVQDLTASYLRSLRPASWPSLVVMLFALALFVLAFVTPRWDLFGGVLPWLDRDWRNLAVFLAVVLAAFGVMKIGDRLDAREKRLIVRRQSKGIE